MLLGDVGVAATPERIAWTYDRLVTLTEELFVAGDVEWRPGARAALRTVRAAGLPTALVTNSLRRITELALEGIGREYFDVSVCGDEVPAGKPAPDPYLRAAELLGVPIESCVAVEDSPNGALAAERAGAAVLVVPCEVPVPAGPGRVHRVDLVGLTAAELGAVLAAVRHRRRPGGVRDHASNGPRAVRRSRPGRGAGPGHPAHATPRRSHTAHPDSRVTSATTDTVSDNGKR